MVEILLVAAATGALIWVTSCAFSPEAQAERVAKEVAEQKVKEAKRVEDAKPRKVSEANGCEVWAFKPHGRWQYFTRCGSATETTNVWEECRSVSSGKTTRTECTPHSMTVTQEKK